jgi:hypothetical protein
VRRLYLCESRGYLCYSAEGSTSFACEGGEWSESTRRQLQPCLSPSAKVNPHKSIGSMIEMYALRATVTIAVTDL